MGTKMTKKNTNLIILLILLFVICLGAGIYFLLKPNNFLLSGYQVNKYSDLVEWCKTDTKSNELDVDCKALLLEIRVIDQDNICADVQIITKDKELKNFSICENGNVISYSNDVFENKKLIPLEIMLVYNRENILSDYNLNSISVSKLEDAYLQNIVNEDISSLVSLNPTSTSIQNSVDFCPNPKMLPTYVSDKNKNLYTEFYNKNILTKERYTEIFSEEFNLLFLDNWTDSSINILFGCESASRLGYTALCSSAGSEEYKGLNLSKFQTFVYDWSKLTNENRDLVNLKKISLTIDGMLFTQKHENYSSPKNIELLLQLIYDSDSNQNVYCSEYQLFDKLVLTNPSLSDQISTMRTVVNKYISTASPICLAILDKNLYSNTGIYLKSFYSISSNELSIYEKCNNLYSLMVNE